MKEKKKKKTKKKKQKKKKQKKGKEKAIYKINCATPDQPLCGGR